MKKLLFVVLLFVCTIILSEPVQAEDTKPFTAEYIAWGKCTWKVAAEYNQTELYRRIVFNEIERKEGDYLLWEDFDILVVSRRCGEIPNFMTTSVGWRYDVLRLTYSGKK